MDAYAMIPMIALGCYLILLIAFLSSKKTVVTGSFMNMLVVYLLWTFGSMCMRMGIMPSASFWFHLSLLGLLLIPCSMLHFCFAFTGKKDNAYVYFAAAGSLALWAVNLAANGFFISQPSLVTRDGSMIFIYDKVSPWVLVPFLYVLLVLFWTDRELVRYKRKSLMPDKEFLMLSLGKVILLLGNLLTVLPCMDGFPVDLFCGILNALLIFAVLCRSRRFKLTLAVSLRVYRMLVMTSAFLFLMHLEIPYRHFIHKQKQFPWLEENLSFGMVSIFTVMFLLIFILCEYFADQVFTKDRDLQAEGLKSFSAAICQTLDMQKVLRLIQDRIQEWLDVEWLEFCIWEEEKGWYRLRRQEENGLQLTLSQESLLIAWAEERRGCIDMQELLHRKGNAGISQEQLQQMKDKGIRLLLPIMDQDRLYALLLLSGRRMKKEYRQEEKYFLESIASLSGVAVRNARMYEEAYWEARTDELTHVGNRKYFYEVISALEGQELTQPISLLKLDLDDFKVYNQLYGSEGGDRMLQKVAALTEHMTGGDGCIFRYGATEFAVLLHGGGREKAYELAESIRRGVMDITQGMDENQMMVTVSCGISCEERGMISGETLVNNCNMAVFQAKQGGKNCTVVYNESVRSQPDDGLRRSNGAYSEYAAVFRALTAAIDAKDHYTYDHSQSVAYYAVELARAWGMGADSVKTAKEAGLLHDIGKIGIPESILQKPGRLTEGEYEIMKGHVEQSIAILGHLPSLEYVIPAVLGHHERYDGKGYPRGLAGDQIPVLARILCIADSFDAMISKRSYKESYSLEYSLKQLKESSGTQFDPELAKMFISLLQNGSIQVRHMN